MKNKYIKVSHISEPKFRKLVKLFSEDLSATQIANLINLNRNTVNRYLMLFRERIAKICDEASPLSGEVKVDESYFEDSKDKAIVFGLLRQEGKVYTEILHNLTKTTLEDIVKYNINIDGRHGYHGLVDVSSDKYFRVYHGKDEWKSENSQLNSIEYFWSYTKIRLMKFHGMDKKTFNLHLKESEFRFNNRGMDLYKILLKTFRKEPLG